MKTIYLVLDDDGLFVGIYGTVEMAEFVANDYSDAKHNANIVTIGINENGATVDIEGVLYHTLWHNDTDIPYCH